MKIEKLIKRFRKQIKQKPKLLLILDFAIPRINQKFKHIEIFGRFLTANELNVSIRRAWFRRSRSRSLQRESGEKNNQISHWIVW